MAGGSGANACYICPRFGSIWCTDYNGTDVHPGTSAGLTWIKLPEMQTWELTADVTDPDEFVTSETGGSAVRPCPGTTTWSFTTNWKLCQTNWLYAYLLGDPADSAVTHGGWANPNDLACKWFYFSWTQDAPTQVTSDRGIYAVGQVNAGGFGLDNNASTAAETAPTIEVVRGPFLPPSATVAGSPRPLVTPPAGP